MKLSFAQKLWLPLILSLLCLAGISVYDAYQTRETRLEERKADLRHASEVALSVVKMYGDEVTAGTLPEAEAQKRAMDSIRHIRYGEDGYFVLSNSQPIALMHPTKPSYDGKDVSDFKDANGVYVYKEMVAVVKRDGKGFTAYSAQRPGATEASPKISYVVAYQPWDWILSTGAYVDDIDAAFRSTLYRSLGILLLIAAALSGVVVQLNRGILRSLGGDPSYAAEIANQIASNDLTAVVKTAPADRSSLLFSMKRMQEQLTHTIGTIKVSADSIATATHQIAAGNQDLSQRTEEQAASLEETAASIEQLTSTVKQTAENAKQASSLAQGASSLAAPRGRADPAGGGHDESHGRRFAPDCRYRRRDRGHRVPDQYPRAQCRGRSGPSGRAGPRVCGGGERSALARAAQRGRGQRDQDDDRRFECAGADRRTTGRALGHDDDRDRRLDRPGERDHERDRCRGDGAEHRHRSGQSRGRADG